MYTIYTMKYSRFATYVRYIPNIFFLLIFRLFSDNAWVTLATNDSYSLGALVLAHSLKAVRTVHKLAILITPGVTAPMKYD